MADSEPMQEEGKRPPPTPNPHAPDDAVGEYRRVRARQFDGPGLLIFSGRCQACQARLNKIARSLEPDVPFRHVRPLVSYELEQRLTREAAEAALAHYSAQVLTLSLSAGMQARELLNEAVMKGDMAEINRLSQLLLDDSLSHEAGRYYSCLSEKRALESALKVEGPFVSIMRSVTAPRGPMVDAVVPKDCNEEAVACCDCDCSDDFPLPQYALYIELEYSDHYPSWPSPFHFYALEGTGLVSPTGRTQPAMAMTEDRVKTILTAAALEEQGKLSDADQIIRDSHLQGDEWKIVTRKPLRRQPWRVLEEEVRTYLLDLTGGEPLLSADLPKQVRDLLNALVKDPMTSDEAIEKINQHIDEWEYPQQNVKRAVVDKLRLKLQLSQKDPLPEWVNLFLNQWRNPTGAADLIVNGLVTEANFREKMPSRREKLRAVIGRFSPPVGGLNAVTQAWQRAKGQREPPKKFMDLYQSNPDMVSIGINLGLITARNYLTLKGEFGSWSRAVQLYSGLKIQCNGLDPTLDSQAHLFKKRQDGTRSASLVGWAKDFLVNGKMSPTQKLALLIKGEANETNYQSLFRKARGGPAPQTRGNKPRSNEQGARTSGAELQPSRAGKKGRAARTYADAAKVGKQAKQTGSRQDGDSNESRILDLLASLDRRLQQIERPNLATYVNPPKALNLRYDPRTGGYMSAD